MKFIRSDGYIDLDVLSLMYKGLLRILPDWFYKGTHKVIRNTLTSYNHKFDQKQENLYKVFFIYICKTSDSDYLSYMKNDNNVFYVVLEDTAWKHDNLNIIIGMA